LNIKIDYDGAYPNLCSGKLTVTVEGSEIKRANKVWSFPSHCMSPGGGIHRSADWDM